MTGLKRALAGLRARGLGPATIYLTASVLARGGAIVLIPLYTRKLSLEEYGEYALAQTLVQLLPTFLSFGLLSAVGRFFYEGKDLAQARIRVAGVARWMILLCVTMAGLLQLLVLLFWPNQGTGLGNRWEISCVIWAAVGTAVAAIPSMFLRASQRPLAAAAFQLGQFLTMASAGLLLVAVLGRGLRGAIEATALASMIDGLLGLGFTLLALRGPTTLALLRESIRFSLPFIPHFAANQLQQIGDRWIMKAVGLQADLGAYALAGQICAPVSMATIAWNDAASPRFGELYRDGGLPGVQAKIGGIRRSYLLSAGVPSALLLLGLPLISLVLGPRVSGSLWLVPLLCAVMLIETLYYPNWNVVFFASKSAWIPRITISAGLLNLLLNVILIAPFGALGAVAARALSMSFRSGVMWWAARRCFRLAT